MSKMMNSKYLLELWIIDIRDLLLYFIYKKGKELGSI